MQRLDNHSKIRKLISTLWPYLLITVGAIIIESPQVQNGNIILGADSIFHFNRFYDTAMQIRHHTWQYWISIYGFHHSARIVNPVYSPYLAYFLGYVLLKCGSFVNFQILIAIVLPLIAGICFESGLKIANLDNQRTQILIAAYPFTYQIIHWDTSNAFTSIGMIAMPLVVGCAIRMLANDEAKISPLQLGLVLALTLQLHMITALESCILMIIVIPIAFAKDHDRPSFTSDLSKVIIIVMLLSLNIIGGLWELFSNNHITPLSSLNFNGDRSFSLTSITGDEFSDVILFIILAFLLLVTFAVDKWQTKLVGTLALFFYLISSRLIPWGFLMSTVPGIKIIQYPSRFLELASSLSFFFIAMLLSSNTLVKWFKSSILVLLGLSIVGTVVYNQQGVRNSSEQIYYSANRIHRTVPKSTLISDFRGKDLGKAINDVYQGSADYLPLRKNYTNPYPAAYNDNINGIYNDHLPKVVTKPKVVGDHLDFYITSHSKKLSQHVHVPAVEYSNTQVSAPNNSFGSGESDAKHYHVRMPKTSLQKGKNVVSVNYTPNIVDNILIIISLLTWVLCLTIIIVTWLQLKIYRLET